MTMTMTMTMTMMTMTMGKNYDNCAGHSFGKHSALAFLFDPRFQSTMSDTTWISALLDSGIFSYSLNQPHRSMFRKGKRLQDFDTRPMSANDSSACIELYFGQLLPLVGTASEVFQSTQRWR